MERSDSQLLWGWLQMTAICLGIAVLIYFFKRYVDGPVFAEKDVDLKGKVAVVTGGNGGIGFQVVKQLAVMGCCVIIGARNRQNAEESIKKIKEINCKAQVEFIYLDLASKTSIQQFSNAITAQKIDFLVNNAGIMGISSRKLTEQGAEMHWAVNHLGHFYLTYLLWNKLIKSNSFRIVNVSSRGHRQYIGFFQTVSLDFQNINFDNNYDPHMAYSRSKLYNVLFTRALASKIDRQKGLVLSMNPGVVRTDILSSAAGQGLKRIILSYILKLIWPVLFLFTKSSKQGAATILHVLLNENIKNGCYYSQSKLAQENPCVTQNNWNILWNISEQYLNIKFNP